MPAPRDESALMDFRSILWKTLTGVIVIIVLVLLKMSFEHTTFGEGVDLSSYVTLQHVLSPSMERENLACQIVNIDGIRPQPIELNGEEVSITPRRRLTPIIEAIINSEPVSLGVDIDCSAWKGVPITPEDNAIFNEWKAFADQHKVDLFLAVQRTRDEGHEKWLPSPSLSAVAAAIATQDKLVRYHVQWVSAPNSSDRLIGMGPALAGKRQVLDDESSRQPSGIIRTSIVTDEYENLKRVSNIQYALTDYSFLSDLKKTVIRANEAVTIDANASRLKNKMVLVGDAGLENGADTFVLPFLSDEPVPGIFLHACAALTEQKSSLYEFTSKGRLLMDAVLSGTVLLIVSSIRVWNYSTKQPSFSPENVEKLLLVLAAIIVVLLGFGIVIWTHLIWTDFALVAIVLLLHKPFHELTHHGWKISVLICREVGKIFGVKLDKSGT